MAAAGKISIVIEALTANFETDMNRASKTAQKRMKEIERSAKEAGAVIGAALAAGITASVIAIKSAIDRADELSKAASKIGIPTEVLSQLEYAGKLANVSFEEIQKGVEKLVKFQGAAAQGAKENVRVFEAFGIAIKDSAGNLRDTNDVLRDFADVFKALPDGPAKTALAMDVFGKSGADLIPLLNEGRQGLSDMADEASRLGVVIDTETGKRAEQFNDNITRLETAISGLATAVASDLLPDLVDLTNEFTANYTEGSNLKETAHEIGDAFRFIAGVTMATVAAVKSLTSIYIGLYNVMLGLMKLTPPGWVIAKTSGLSGPLADFKSAGIAFDQAKDTAFPGAGGAVDRHQAPGDVISRGGSRETQAEIARRQSAVAAANRLFSPAADATNKKAKADHSAEQAARDYAKAVDDLNKVLSQQAETTGGPLLKAAYDYKDAMVNIDEIETELNKLGKNTAENQSLIAAAREQATAAYEKQVAAIQNQKKPIDELLEDMQFELDLLGKTNAERTVANELRRLETGMTEDQIKAFEKENAAKIEQIKTTEQAIESQQKQISAMDEFRSSMVDNISAVLDGSKSIKDAFKDMATAILAQIARLIAQQWVDKLFGAQGTSGSGTSGGDFLGSIFGALFGGGKAVGGPVMAGVPYLVGEKGPELMIPSAAGNVIPNHALRGMGGGDVTQVFNNNYAAPQDPRTISQQAAKVGFETRRVLQRNGR